MLAGDWNEQLGPPFRDHIGDHGGNAGLYAQHMLHFLVEQQLSAINSFVQHEPSRHGHSRARHQNAYSDLDWIMCSRSLPLQVSRIVYFDVCDFTKSDHMAIHG